ncbi:MAG: TerB family tellurite resistance protein, partial [Pseudomonadota bacterium]
MTDFLESIRRIINCTGVDSAAEPDKQSIARAAAVLLIELALADDATHDSERAVIEAAMTKTFGLTSNQLDALLDEAEA